MMAKGISGFGYMQARVQARYAQLADNILWSQLGAVEEFSAYLEECRTTGLSPFVSGISNQSSSHQIDSTIRRTFIQFIVELSSWVPKPWQSTFLWLRWLPEIPIISYLLNEKNSNSWPYDINGLSIALKDKDLPISNALYKAGAECLIAQGSSPSNMINMWLQQWPNLWPKHSARFSQGIEELLNLIQGDYKRFKTLPCGEAWKARTELQNRLRLLFRQCQLQPATALSYIVLLSLQLERLRAELLHRLLFPDKRLML